MDGRLILLTASIVIHFAATKRQFVFVNEPRDWTAAQAYCREKYTDLVTIYDAQENEKLVTFAQNEDGCIWMGLYYNLETWRWTMGDPAHYIDEKNKMWAASQPREEGDQHCTAMSAGDRQGVSDMYCTDNYNFICFDAVNKYTVVEQKITWDEARAYCRANHEDLAIIDDDDVFQKLLDEVNKMAGEHAWIGLYRDPWSVWSDNKYTTFSHWSTEPTFYSQNGHCGCIFGSTGKWSESLCSAIKPFFCYKDLDGEKQTILNVKLQSEMDLSNNEIQAQITEQMKKQLTSMGAGNVAVKWRFTKPMTPDEPAPNEKCVKNV